MLNGTDYIAIAGVVVAGTVPMGIFIASGLRKGRTDRERQHQEGQDILHSLDKRQAVMEGQIEPIVRWWNGHGPGAEGD